MIGWVLILVPNDVELNNDRMELIVVPNDVELNNDRVELILVPNDVELNNDRVELILVPNDVELNNDRVELILGGGGWGVDSGTKRCRISSSLQTCTQLTRNIPVKKL